MKSILPVAFASVVLVGGAAFASADNAIYVCPKKAQGCDFYGDGGLQEAVDAAASGAHIVLRRGRYHPNAYRDTPFVDEGEGLLVRGYVTIQDRDLSISAEEGAVIDGGKGIHTSAFVVNNSKVVFEGLAIEGFRAAEKEDNVYDGHGVFIIDSKAELKDVVIEGVEKMALTGRGDSTLSVSGLRIYDSHLGIWLEEDAVLRLENSVLKGSESAGLAVYDRTNSLVVNSEVSENLDDGVYATGAAQVCVTNSVISNNKPYGLRAVEDGAIKYDYSAIFGNEKSVYTSAEEGLFIAGEGNLFDDSAALVSGNPAIKRLGGAPSAIGVINTELEHSMECAVRAPQ